ncbi:hypothetical protein B0H12DRAFT_1123021 [Mycena haematopus]|nr:hypothetical protein B0H12DRAFT_1123021 [Mycena haematopus]
MPPYTLYRTPRKSLIFLWPYPRFNSGSTQYCHLSSALLLFLLNSTLETHLADPISSFNSPLGIQFGVRLPAPE